ncbi:hypothetical protein [Niallia endozanthoxylica]|uniref:Uncharacterized protein n=1 Tax=Niallia endozanthoxylica TaxID=2036016 RepID=A0A5J5I7A6_9BACI|nr:hypothetical protein [Niallia endozanthoxylica]KAA9030656.1 hypothetical protein F4V44_02365 [Niallia endozanthoxylica]
MATKKNVVVEQQIEECPTCPEGTVCEDSDLLCINIPCTTTVVLLGLIQLNIGPLCIRAGSVGNLSNLSDQEKLEQVQQVFSVLRNTLPNFTAE